MGCSGSSEKLPSFGMDFGDIEPQSEEERQIVDMVTERLNDSDELLTLLQGYQGCEGQIREALNNHEKKSYEKKAWKAVSAAVSDLHQFFLFSKELEEVFPILLGQICDIDDSEAAVQGNQAVCKLIGQLFNFVFNFDQLKMIHPQIQNDFAYYRRVLGRMKGSKKKLAVDEETANKMSFFFAYPTPMMKVIIDITTAYNDNEGGDKGLVNALSILAGSCAKTITDIISNGEGDGMLYLTTITGCVILVDHLDPIGAFHSKSLVPIKSSCQAISEYNAIESTAFLINSLRFTARHLNDDSTISAVHKYILAN